MIQVYTQHYRDEVFHWNQWDCSHV